MCRVQLVVLIVFIAMMLPGCGGSIGNGYRKVDGKWSYVSWSTASGQEVKPLGADESLRVLENPDYAKDQAKVFYLGEELRDADADTFVIDDHPHYAMDKNYVYLFGHRVTGADPETFEVINAPYARDAQRAYCGTIPMNVVNLDNFEVVSVDGTWSTVIEPLTVIHLFGEEFAALEVTPENPAVTADGWARDGQYWYAGPSRVDGADYPTFAPIDSHSAADANRRYRRAFPETAWPERIRKHDQARARKHARDE